MKKYKELENHNCANNDGEHICTCFDKGFKKGRKKERKLVVEEIEGMKVDAEHNKYGDAYNLVINQVIKKLV